MISDAVSLEPSEPPGIMRLLHAELAQTNHDVLLLTLDLDRRLEERASELRTTQEELQRTNSELLQLTLELDERVAQRTEQLAQANASLRAEVARRTAVEEEIRRLNAELERRVEERTAELAAANAELESFAYSVSHDLRAPLRGIDGWSQALFEDYADHLDERARGYLTTVCSEARRMGELIDALLKLSRMTRSEMRRESVDLSRLARTIVAEWQARQPDREVELLITPGLVDEGDRALLRALLENLLGNAWKFTSKRAKARIEFGAELDTGPASAPVYFVRDNGAGFDMAFAAKLFAPFQRLHGTAEFPGNGIGLATVHRIVHRHGGRVWAEGVVGQGAVVYFTLRPGVGGPSNGT